MQATLPTLFSLAFIGIGIALFSSAINMARKGRQSLSWPSTEGEIAHSAVLFQTESSPSQGRNSTFKADIAYRYKVNGRSYSSAKIAVLDLSSTMRSAQSLVDRYPDKSKIDVFYNPRDPSDAVLEPGSSSGVTVLYLIGGVFVAAGLLFLVTSLTGHVHMA